MPHCAPWGKIGFVKKKETLKRLKLRILKRLSLSVRDKNGRFISFDWLFPKRVTSSKTGQQIRSSDGGAVAEWSWASKEAINEKQQHHFSDGHDKEALICVMANEKY